MELFLTSSEGVLISAPFSIKTITTAVFPSRKAQSTGVRPSYRVKGRKKLLVTITNRIIMIHRFVTKH